MELPEHSLAIFALDKQLNNIHKTKLLTTHTYIKQMLFLSNLELSISPIVNDPGLLLPQESDFETIFIDQVNELFDNCTSDSQDFQGILIQKGPPPLKIPLAASDASLFTYNDRKFAASAAFFGISSRLNVAIPTFDSSISTELPEITGIIIALQQAVSNKVPCSSSKRQYAWVFRKATSYKEKCSQTQYTNKKLLRQTFSVLNFHSSQYPMQNPTPKVHTSLTS